MKDESRKVSVTVHKEKMTARNQSDAADRETLSERLTSCIEPLNPDDHQITWSVFYALEVDPPIVEFTHDWTKDEVSSACPLPQDVKPVPDDVLIMIRCGTSSTRPCATARCSCSTARLSCSVFCGYHGAEDYCFEQTKSSTLPDEDEDE